MSLFDPVMLARIQFAFTISFHIIFPSITIGLASFLAVIEFRWLQTGNLIFAQLYKMWVKVFAICFGMGVVSGVVMSYQFGTNWSLFSDRVGNVIGPLLGYEVLTAFFLESSFLGIMLFGWDRVSKRMHFTSTVIVACGTVISAFWIMAANSWMQTPTGYRIAENGILFPTSWIQIIFNPSMPYRLAHMVIAAYITTAFIVLGVSGFYFLRNQFRNHAKIMMVMSIFLLAVMTPLQLILGDLHGVNTHKYQPAKIAAMEAQWDTQTRAPLRLFAIPSEKNQSNQYEISIPALSSLIITRNLNGTVLGLKTWKAEDRPPVGITFWSFRVMVGLGCFMIFTALWGLYLYYRKKLFHARFFHILSVVMIPSGLIAILAGWFVAEIGRQPYTAYGVIRTVHSVSPVIGPQVALSLLIFVLAYFFIFGAGVTYIFYLLKAGPLKYVNQQGLQPQLELLVKETLPKKSERKK